MSIELLEKDASDYHVAADYEWEEESIRLVISQERLQNKLTFVIYEGSFTSHFRGRGKSEDVKFHFPFWVWFADLES